MIRILIPFRSKWLGWNLGLHLVIIPVAKIIFESIKRLINFEKMVVEYWRM